MRKDDVKTRILKTIAAGSVLLNGGGISALASELKTDRAKASYAIGQQIGRGLKAQHFDPDIRVLSAAIEDALKDRPSKLNDNQMKEAFGKLQEEANKKAEVQAGITKQEGEKFLEANKKEKGFTTKKSGLQYRIVKEGQGESPKNDSQVRVHYQGTFIDGTEFDSSYSRNEPAVFQVDGVIPGWTEALKMMKPGAEWELVIPGDLAYGSRGRPGIPPNSVLKFKIHLLAILSDKEDDSDKAK